MSIQRLWKGLIEQFKFKGLKNRDFISPWFTCGSDSYYYIYKCIITGTIILLYYVI